MPGIQLLTAVVQRAINSLLQLDESTPKRLKELAGNRLIVAIEEFNQPLALVFSADSVDVLALQEPLEEIVASLSKSECLIATNLSVLPSLQSSSQLTSLIRQNKLRVEGELAIAQQVSELFSKLNIDWEELFAQKTNDVIAHQTFSVAKAVWNSAEEAAARGKLMLRDMLVEEKPIAASKIALLHFYDQVDEIRNDTARFEAKLEAKLQALRQSKVE